MRVIIATTQVPFVYGGAEIHARGLCDAIRGHGHQVEIVAIPFKWYPAGLIIDNIVACRLLDLTESNGQSVDRLIGLKFPAYLISHPNKVMWILHQHRTAYELWDHPFCDLVNEPDGIEVRDAIREADCRGIPEAKRIFTISQTVSRRLKLYNNIDSQPLYHPPEGADDLYCAEAEGYFFFPSRLVLIKRQYLVLEALAKTRNKGIRVKFAGLPDTAGYAEDLKKMARKLRVEERVDWLGKVTHRQKCDLYANSLGVVFCPVDEDYGYVTLEAMASAKPVITGTDSGGPLEFVSHGATGLITEPSAEAIALAMDELWQDRNKAIKLGREGRGHYESLNLGWDNVVKTLLE